MSLQQILVVLAYSAKPYWWLIALAMLALATAFTLGSIRRGSIKRLAYAIAAAVGLIAALIAPAVTHSSLSYVATPTDWLALVGIGISTAFYTLLLLWPLLRRES
ncbi:MAG: hypothetical protein CMI01_15755 [Oceanospirillaceae bacterium]|nr:hypothetical protein [Oceanospirillaceae bacterium]